MRIPDCGLGRRMRRPPEERNPPLLPRSYERACGWEGRVVVAFRSALDPGGIVASSRWSEARSGVDHRMPGKERGIPEGILAGWEVPGGV